MNTQFDNYGWLDVTNQHPHRTTDVEPPEHGEEPIEGEPWPMYDGCGAWFMQPYVKPDSEPTPEDRRITRLMFRNRFTQAEHVTIEIASLDDAAAPMQQRQMAAALRVMQRQVSDAEFIDLNDLVTRAGVQQLEAFGLLAEGRAAEILDGSLAPE